VRFKDLGREHCRRRRQRAAVPPRPWHDLLGAHRPATALEVLPPEQVGGAAAGSGHRRTVAGLDREGVFTERGDKRAMRALADLSRSVAVLLSLPGDPQLPHARRETDKLLACDLLLTRR
jgi:hypothetical protein